MIARGAGIHPHRDFRIISTSSRLGTRHRRSTQKLRAGVGDMDRRFLSNSEFVVSNDGLDVYPREAEDVSPELVPHPRSGNAGLNGGSDRLFGLRSARVRGASVLLVSKGATVSAAIRRLFLGMVPGVASPVALGAAIFLALAVPRMWQLENNFVYSPSGRIELPKDVQIDPLLMQFALPGYSATSVDNSGDSPDATQAVAPPADLSKFQSLRLQTYTIKPGDSISGIATRHGLNQDTLISFNDISDVRRIRVGATFQIPNKNGLRYTVRRGDSLSGISKKYDVGVNELLDANNLNSTVLSVGQELFIPGARMDPFQLDLVLGVAFRWPVLGATMTSPFGFRPDPFTGVRDFHNGIDLALYYGAPIHAAGNGIVKDVGYNSIYGNYVVISHADNFQTLYGHMSKQLARVGQHVTAGQTIGLMGSTGYSTGTHLHFTIYHNYQPVNPLKYLP
ncbi:MAG TPA: M23 family metallopeptidase [Spirochaetia bacterium]|nr:M23 family metallopeptidase [Spirochaetia bacterium]